MTQTRIIALQEADGTTHHIERRTGDMGILYRDHELARLALGLPVWRGLECHLDLEAHAARIAGERVVTSEPDWFGISAGAVVFVAVSFVILAAILAQ